ncbi:MAG: sigma 54-interacting transcriptional regulator [Deltaproteobacteria bacterium]|nr:sigma 54-interacting transcriptional regulator [Deltaproteobacteria bacterium]
MTSDAELVQLPDLLGSSESLLRVKERLSRVAKVERPVLILGDRGTGKELAAARIHYLSPRWQAPYVTVNCAALAPELLDSELFGHEAGAFTGAVKRHRGRFEAADSGTLFLDEISHLTLGAQARILRVVEYGSFQPVGSTAERRIDVRVLAATNADLKKMCRQGTFLADLWDRLSFEVITLPPLKDRAGDITILAHFFGARMARELGLKSPPIFSPEALEALETHLWPGNVRELKNVVERAVYRSESVGPAPLIGPEHLQLDTGIFPPSVAQPDHLPSVALLNLDPRPPANHNLTDAAALLPLPPGGYDQHLRQSGLQLVRAALEKAHHNQGRAAELLGMSYHRFRALKKKLETPQDLSPSKGPEPQI